VKPKDLSLASPKEKNYIIFCGHRGCGKSTELRILSSKLNKKDLFFVVFIDATIDLDTNNLQYSDLLMALAKKLFEELEKASVEINSVFLSNLESWFNEKIESNEKTRDFATEVKAGIKVEGGVPFLAKLYGGITNSFKTNST
jgi:energy-coupling factor transporter ATP-binding protein EcfA2